jgi:hypothetical protein
MNKQVNNLLQPDRKTLKKITDHEQDRLGSSGVVYTNAFSARQTFGPASGVIHINPKDISPEELERLVSL